MYPFSSKGVHVKVTSLCMYVCVAIATVLETLIYTQVLLAGSDNFSLVGTPVLR